MCMIGKLSTDQKADWPKHLPELVHAYNCTRSAITGYSPHYLLFGHQPHLPIDFYFLWWGHGERLSCQLLCCWVTWMTVRSLQGGTSTVHLRGWDRSGAMTGKLMLFHWRQVMWSWLKLTPTGGRGKWRTGGRRNHIKWNTQVAEGVPLYLMKNQQTGCSWVLHWNWLFLIAPGKGTPLCTVMWAKQAWCTPTTLEEQTPERSETQEAPWNVNCLPLAQGWTAGAPLGWMNKKLCAILWTFSGASLLHQGWKFQCRGTRGVRESMLVFWWQRNWSHWWG